PFGLVDCLVYFKKRFIFIDDILAEKQQVFKLNLSDLKKTEIFNDQQAERVTNRLASNGTRPYLKTMQRNLTKAALLQVHNKYRSRRDSLYLIGWGQGGVVQPTFMQTNPAGKRLTMVNWVLPVEITS
ncbi:MAG: hypothetical protein PVG84_06530, partial [Desulfobacterales bacterium]